MPPDREVDAVRGKRPATVGGEWAGWNGVPPGPGKSHRQVADRAPRTSSSVHRAG